MNDLKWLINRIALPIVLLFLISCGGGGGGGGGGSASSLTTEPNDTTAPSGYSVSGLASLIDASNQSQVLFSVAGAEIDSTYVYDVFSSGSGATAVISNSDVVTSADFSVPAFDISAAADGEINIDFYLQDQAGNRGDVLRLVATKNSQSIADAIRVTGTITFDLVPHDLVTNGLDYDRISVQPARGVTVQAVNGAETELATTVTDENGDYSLSLPSNTELLIRVKAEMVQNLNASWDVSITDNTNSNALYALQGNLVNTGSEDAVRDLHAPSGWGGDGYTSTRAAAPFAILDAVYETVQKFAVADPNVKFPALEIRWSINNNSASGNNEDGDIGTSFYNGTAIYILGDQDADTDEYDRHIIVHEWGHYFEDRLSRSDSIGGPHSTGDKLDLRVAFGEGWGNALSGMILDDSVYRDSSGNNQAFGFSIDVDDNANSNAGWFNEGSVQSILYDLYDADDDGADSIELGLQPLYATLIDADYTGDDYLTSIFSFVEELKIQQPASVTAIDALLLAQTIDGTGSDGSGETNDGGNSNVLPVYKSVAINGAAVSLCSTAGEGDYNKLGVRDFVYLTIASADTYSINAINDLSGATDRDPDLEIWQAGTVMDISDSAVVDQETWSGVLGAGNYLIEIYDYKNINSLSIDNSSSCYDLTVTN